MKCWRRPAAKKLKILNICEKVSMTFAPKMLVWEHGTSHTGSWMNGDRGWMKMVKWAVWEMMFERGRDTTDHGGYKNKTYILVILLCILNT